MIAARALLSRLAPLLACVGLLAIWQVGALILNTESFPTALEAIRAVPSILGDKESLINILASLRRMASRNVGAICASSSMRRPRCTRVRPSMLRTVPSS